MRAANIKYLPSFLISGIFITISIISLILLLCYISLGLLLMLNYLVLPIYFNKLLNILILSSAYYILIFYFYYYS